MGQACSCGVGSTAPYDLSVKVMKISNLPKGTQGVTLEVTFLDQKEQLCAKQLQGEECICNTEESNPWTFRGQSFREDVLHCNLDLGADLKMVEVPLSSLVQLWDKPFQKVVNIDDYELSVELMVKEILEQDETTVTSTSFLTWFKLMLSRALLTMSGADNSDKAQEDAEHLGNTSTVGGGSMRPDDRHGSSTEASESEVETDAGTVGYDQSQTYIKGDSEHSDKIPAGDNSKNLQPGMKKKREDTPRTARAYVTGNFDFFDM